MFYIPFYLQKRFIALNITNVADIVDIGYLAIFKRLKALDNSLSNQQTIRDLMHICAQPNQYTFNSLHTQDNMMNKNDVSHLLLPDIQLAYLDVANIEANKSFMINEVPVGAVLVIRREFLCDQLAAINQDNINQNTITLNDDYNSSHQYAIIGRGHNQTNVTCDITAHAEIIAIRQAQKYIMDLFNSENNHLSLSYIREIFSQAVLYTTIDPCLMCLGAIVNIGLKYVVFGAKSKYHIGSSNISLIKDHSTRKNSSCHINCIGPINNQKYSDLIKKFFINQRKKINHIQTSL